VRCERACRKFLGAAVATALAVTQPVRAEPPSPQAIAQAEALFQEGKRLMAKGSYAEACPKLAESQKLDPGGGTLVTLVLCHESEGRTASAWAEFGEALTLALKDGRVDRATVAREHGARLEPKLSRLTVRVPPSVSVLAAVQISQDGIELGRPSWGMALPVDPGEHQIVARAPGKKPWTRFVVVAADADRQAIEVAPFEDEPVAPTPPAPTEIPSAPASGSGYRNAGWIIGGTGVVLLGIGSYFGIRAIADHSTAKDRCPTSACTDLEGVRANDSSRNEADLATAGFALGGAALGVAAFLFLTSPPSALAVPPSSRKARVRWEPRFLGRGAGAALSADW
jgi:hypothetical protein